MVGLWSRTGGVPEAGGFESTRASSLTCLRLGLELGLGLAASWWIQAVLDLSWGCQLQCLPMASAFGLGISHQGG